MNKVGRPRTENPKEHRLSVRLTDDEFIRLKTYAERLNTTMSKVVHNEIQRIIEADK